MRRMTGTVGACAIPIPPVSHVAGGRTALGAESLGSPPMSTPPHPRNFSLVGVLLSAVKHIGRPAPLDVLVDVHQDLGVRGASSSRVGGCRRWSAVEVPAIYGNVHSRWRARWRGSRREAS